MTGGEKLTGWDFMDVEKLATQAGLLGVTYMGVTILRYNM